MSKTMIAHGFVHTVPRDIGSAFVANPKCVEVWNTLTPLARNEWICWVISVKKQETRRGHIKRMCEDLLRGKRRPCCWAGCPHRVK